jgi:hypothetical protein
MYSSQFIRVEVDWSVIKLNFIPFHSNTCGLGLIRMHQTSPKVDRRLGVNLPHLRETKLLDIGDMTNHIIYMQF